jgi:hypothetical protein
MAEMAEMMEMAEVAEVAEVAEMRNGPMKKDVHESSRLAHRVWMPAV